MLAAGASVAESSADYPDLEDELDMEAVAVRDVDIRDARRQHDLRRGVAKSVPWFSRKTQTSPSS